MEKLILVPYVKYQRMQEMTPHPKTPGDNSTSTKVTKPKEIEIQQQQMPVVNLVTPVAQAIEIAKSEIERKRRRMVTIVCIQV